MKALGWIVGLIVGAVGGILVGIYVLAPDGGDAEATKAVSGTTGEEEPSAEAAGANQGTVVRWRMASTFASQWPIHGDLGVMLVENIAKATGGTVQVKYFEPGALVPALELFDAVSAGSVDAGWSSPGYWAGKEAATPLFTTVPFGPNMSEYLAWLYGSDGEELFRELYAKYNIMALHCGLHPPEGSGWFREPIESLDDLKGLKMRFFGLGGRVMEKLGVSTQMLAGGDVYPALELGTIDALESSMPVSDLAQGFYQIAKHYYLPGWHQQTSLFEFIINMDRWNALTDTQRFQIEMVCGNHFKEGAAMGETMQAAAIAELLAKGTQIHEWPPEFIEVFRQATAEVMEEEAARDETFDKVWASMKAFREAYAPWRDMGYLK
ncbi:MAG: C4-dicarboxylate ABC transporter [Rhodospirillaceae bacterium]|nr:C4-dicarboxylate ABC transporter [Rhodospirillaceae bacterium]